MAPSADADGGSANSLEYLNNYNGLLLNLGHNPQIYPQLCQCKRRVPVPLGREHIAGFGHEAGGLGPLLSRWQIG